MKYMICAGLVIVSVLCAVTETYAETKKKEYFYRPQLGAWFGPIAPVGLTAQDLKTNQGGGVFFRYNIPWEYFKIGADISYQFYESTGMKKLQMIPLYVSGLFLLPIPLPLHIQLKLGVGTSYVKIWPDRSNQWDPLFVGGLEISFPAGRLVNIGARLDYQYLYEAYAKKGKRGGHFINAGIQLFFNL